MSHRAQGCDYISERAWYIIDFFLPQTDPIASNYNTTIRFQNENTHLPIKSKLAAPTDYRHSYIIKSLSFLNQKYILQPHNLTVFNLNLDILYVTHLNSSNSCESVF